MARKQASEIAEVLTLLRRIVVLAVAAYGLAREMPYTTLLVRLTILWAVLYVCCGVLDVLIRRFSYRNYLAQQQAAQGQSTDLSAPHAEPVE
jgi:hypothetical protein